MADNPAQEKTEQATPRKLKKARKEGQVARSTELNSVFIIGFGILIIYMLGPLLFANLGGLMRQTLAEATKIEIAPDSVHLLFSEKIMLFGTILGPILGSLAVIALLINVCQTGVVFSLKSLEPKLEKFNIPKGIKRLVSKRSLAELIRDVIKTVLIALVAYTTISGWVPDYITLGDNTIGNYVNTLGRLALTLALKISAVLFVIAIFDFAFQRYDLASKLKMTKQEIREEMKDTEGNPQLKSRIRQVQQEMARQRMISEIPKADVVVTNPTRIAVALKYDTDTMPAPKVLAKGQRLIAERIRRVARKHNIPIVENKPLAQSLFKLVDIGGYIPDDLYRAVAEVLAYIYRFKEKKGAING